MLASCRRSFRLNNNLCTRCDSTYPAGKMFCTNCPAERLERVCTRALRVTHYFKELRDCGLWPSLGPFENFSVAEIERRILQMKNKCSHQCDGSPCSLRLHVDKLVDAIEQAIAQTTALVWRPIHLSSPECEPARCSTDRIECPVTQTA